MGGSLSSDRNSGSIIIQLDKPKYAAGDQVNGWIHLSLLQAFPCNALYLVISGKEKVRFVTTRQEKDPKTETFKKIVDVHKDSNEFFEHTFPLYSQFGPYFPPGQYSFPFSFKLSDGLPGSFCHEYTSEGERCFAKTVYKLKAGLKDPYSNRAVFQEIRFIVDQRWEFSNGPQQREECKKLTGYCYAELGSFKLSCRYDRDKFIVGENAVMHIEVDNSECKSDVKLIQCSLKQFLRVKTSDGRNSDFKTTRITSAILPGLAKGQKRTGMDAMMVTLPIKTQSELEATSNGNLVENRFMLVIEASMEAALCCDSSPSTELEIKIFNRQYAQSVAPPQFPNWSPQVMSPYVCTMTPQTRMTQEFKNQIYVNKNIQYPHLN